MNRTVLMVAGGVAVCVALFTMLDTGDPTVAGFAVPSWLTNIAVAGGGIITFLLGLFKSPTPLPPLDPNGQPSKLDVLRKIMEDGKFTPDEWKLVLSLFSNGGGSVPIDLNVDLVKIRGIMDQIVQLIAASKQFKEKGIPQYVKTEMVWSPTEAFPFSWGIDPRIAQSIRPQPAPQQ